MNNNQGKISATIADVFHQANNELFNNYTMTFQSATNINGGVESVIEGNSIMSVLTASGDGVKILSTIKMSDEAARLIYPGDGINATDEELEDLCGELSNQLIGKVKNKMLGYDCKLMLGLPTCIRGKNVRSHSPQHAVIIERCYLAGDIPVVVNLHSVVHPEFEMLDSPNEALTGEVSEGTLSFF
jgi:CheY-specific phosphatase CheX